jgi:hypothetical protein
MSRCEIATRTGLSMRAVAYSLKRLLEVGRIFWHRPFKKSAKMVEIALYEVDPELWDA